MFVSATSGRSKWETRPTRKIKKNGERWTVRIAVDRGTAKRAAISESLGVA